MVKPRETESRVKKYHTTYAIIGDITKGRKIRGKRHVDYQGMRGMVDLYLHYRAQNIKEAIVDEYWIKAMQEKLQQFQRNDVW